MHEEGGLKECLPADELGLADHPIVGREAIEDFLRQTAKPSIPGRLMSSRTNLAPYFSYRDKAFSPDSAVLTV